MLFLGEVVARTGPSPNTNWTEVLLNVTAQRFSSTKNVAKQVSVIGKKERRKTVSIGVNSVLGRFAPQ
jgi:hypothetical protein